MPHQTSPQLLWFLCLLSAVCGLTVHNCSNGSSPVVINPKSMRFGIRLSTDSSSGAFCHAVIHRNLNNNDRLYFYVRLNGSLASSHSVLSLSSDLGRAHIATVTASNQAAYRTFATESGSLYARLSSTDVSNASVSDSIMLDVSVVVSHQCPPNFHHHNGTCYGAPTEDKMSFTDAATACHRVRANLAMRFESADVLRSAIGALGWSGDVPVWIGAADSKSGAHFLNGTKFLDQGSWGIGYRGGIESMDWLKDLFCSRRGGGCRCLYNIGGSFHSHRCARRLQFLCSRELDGDKTPYTLEVMDKLLEEPDSWAEILGVVAVAFGMGIAIGLLAFCCALCKLMNGKAPRRDPAPAANRRNAADAVAMITMPPIQPLPPPIQPPPPRYKRPPTYQEVLLLTNVAAD